MKSQSLTGKLTNENIEECIALLHRLPVENFRDKKEKLRLCLTIETLLLSFQSRFGEEKDFSLTVSARFNYVRTAIQVRGEFFNPLTSGNDYDDITFSLLQRMNNKFGIGPSYAYKNGWNNVSVDMRRSLKIGFAPAIAIAFVLAVLCGLIVPEFLTMQELRIPMEIFCTFTDIILGLLKLCAGFLVFLSVLDGITGFSELGQIKARTRGMIRYVTVCYLVMVIVAGLGLFLFPLNWQEHASVSGAFSSLLETVTSIFPSSILQPLADGNLLQIVILALLIGLSSVVVGNSAESFLRVCSSFYRVIIVLTESICWLIPFLIFLMVTELFWDGSLTILGNIWIVGIFLVVLLVLQGLLTLFAASRALGKSYKATIKDMLPLLGNASMTCSSSLLIPELIVRLKKDGVNENDSAFMLPVGYYLCQEAVICVFYFMCLYFASICEIEVSVTWVVLAFLMCTLTAVATPGIGGGSSIVITVLFSAMSISDVLLPAALPLLLLLDFLISPVNVATAYSLSAVSFWRQNKE